MQAQGWERQIGQLGDDVSLESVILTKDHGYAGVGSIVGNFGLDIYVVRTDVDGTILWEKELGSVSGDIGYDIQETDNGDLLVLGYVGSGTAGNRDVYLARLDEKGNLLWENDYGDALNDEGYQLVQLSNGGYAIAGYSDNQFNK